MVPMFLSSRTSTRSPQPLMARVSERQILTPVDASTSNTWIANIRPIIRATTTEHCSSICERSFLALLTEGTVVKTEWA